MKTKAGARKIPFDFVLDHLFSMEPIVKPMFGCHAIYVGEKIMLILRNREDHQDSNGIWIATRSEHHASLRKEFPLMRSIAVLSEGKGETGWQMIGTDNDDFETSAIKLCDMIVRADERIGRVPKAKKKKNKL